MAAVDLHPDVVRAIRGLANTKLGRKYDKFARKRYGVSGPMLAAKTVAGEFGGRSTKTGRGVVSSAGARGPAQFIPSTRAEYMRRYGIDPWRSDREAIQAMMLHHLNTGVEGYNPGMPTYRDYILGQKIDAEDRRALRGRGGGGTLTLEGPERFDVTLGKKVIPGVSFEQERQDARRELLLGGGLSLNRLLDYKRTINSLQDVPDRVVAGDIQVKRRKGKDITVRTRGGVSGGGQVHEVFYDPLGRYYDEGRVARGGIGGHSDHVHVAADRDLVVKMGKLAQRMGLHVGEHGAFGGTPTGGHTQGSFHYRDMAIDVSGDPRKMRRFAQIAMREARKRRRRR